MRKRRAFAVVALVAICVVPSCREVQPDDGEILPSISVGYSPLVSHGPLFVALEEGYFEQEGIEVELHSLPAAETMNLAAVISGELDVYAGLLSVGLLNVTMKSPVKIVADKGWADPSAPCSPNPIILAREPYDSGEIRSVSDLRGRRVSFRESDLNEMMISRVLASGGLTTDDVINHYVPAPNLPDVLGQGTLDMAITIEPYATFIVRQGTGIVWREMTEFIPGMSWGVIAFGDRILHSDRDLGVRFLRAYVRAVETLHEGKTDRNVEIMTQYTSADESLIRDVCWPSYRIDGSVDPEPVLEFAEWAFEKNILDRMPTVEEFWEPSFSREAFASLEKDGQ